MVQEVDDSEVVVEEPSCVEVVHLQREEQRNWLHHTSHKKTHLKLLVCKLNSPLLEGGPLFQEGRGGVDPL